MSGIIHPSLIGILLGLFVFIFYHRILNYLAFFVSVLIFLFCLNLQEGVYNYLTIFNYNFYIKVDKLSLFESISQQSEILSINISVEASKLGKESSSFSKLSRQAKKFSEIISVQISDIKEVIDKVDKSSENSEYLVKTLVMSFVEIESGLKNVSKDISSFLATIQQTYASSSELLKTLEEIGSKSMYLPSFMDEMKKRFKDMEWDFKKIRVNLEEFSKNYNILNLSLENVKNSTKNLYQLIQRAKELL